jgi:hypothetical protein
MACEDFPCCGHEFGDCEGLKYGSDESIKNDPHLLCDHENGECALADEYDEYDEDEENGDDTDVDSDSYYYDTHPEASESWMF